MTAGDTAGVVVCYVAIVAVCVALIVWAFRVGKQKGDLLGFWSFVAIGTIIVGLCVYGQAHGTSNMLNLPQFLH